MYHDCVPEWTPFVLLRVSLIRAFALNDGLIKVPDYKCILSNEMLRQTRFVIAANFVGDWVLRLAYLTGNDYWSIPVLRECCIYGYRRIGMKRPMSNKLCQTNVFFCCKMDTLKRECCHVDENFVKKATFLFQCVKAMPYNIKS